MKQKECRRVAWLFLGIILGWSACNKSDRSLGEAHGLTEESAQVHEQEKSVGEEGDLRETRFAREAVSYRGQVFQQECVLSSGQKLHMDADVCVPEIQEIHKYQYILSEPNENDVFSNKLLYAVLGDRVSELEYKEGYSIRILRNTDRIGDYYMYCVYTSSAGATVYGEQGYMLEYRGANLYPFDDNLLPSVKETRTKMTVEEATELCEQTLGMAQKGQEYIVDFILTYGTQGRTPYYWIVYKRVLDGIVVNAYNDFIFQVDDNGIEKVYGAVYDVEMSEMPEDMLTPEQAVSILIERADTVNSQNQINFSGAETVCVSRISLEYVVVQAMTGETYITPVWRFCLGSTQDERNNLREKILAVDAFTGAIIQEERGHNF